MVTKSLRALEEMLQEEGARVGLGVGYQQHPGGVRSLSVMQGGGRKTKILSQDLVC